MSLVYLPLEILRGIIGHLTFQDLFAVIVYSQILREKLLGNESYNKDLVEVRRLSVVKPGQMSN
jgi:hypothetical protein